MVLLLNQPIFDGVTGVTVTSRQDHIIGENKYITLRSTANEVLYRPVVNV